MVRAFVLLVRGELGRLSRAAARGGYELMPRERAQQQRAAASPVSERSALTNS